MKGRKEYLEGRWKERKEEIKPVGYLIIYNIN